MHIRRICLATMLAVFIGVLGSSPCLAASKSKKVVESEIARLQEENARLRRQVDELVTKMDLLMSRIDQLEKSVAELRSGPAQTAKAQDQIQEEEIVIEARGSEVGATPNLPVIKVEPQKPPAPKTKKVIVFTDDKKNPNNPKISIQTVSSGKSGGKPDPGAKKVITFDDKGGSEPTVTEEKKSRGAEAKPGSLDEVKKLIASKQCREAEARIKSRLAQKPREKEACPLYFYLGEALSLCGRPAEAGTAYLKVGDSYPACELAPGAMFKAGELFEKSDQDKSRKVFEDIVLLYPYSNYANLAEEKLKK